MLIRHEKNEHIIINQMLNSRQLNQNSSANNSRGNRNKTVLEQEHPRPDKSDLGEKKQIG